MSGPVLDVPNAPRLAFLAAMAALEAPESPNRWAASARVRWALIQEIRAELGAAGYDWRALVREVQADEGAAP